MDKNEYSTRKKTAIFDFMQRRLEALHSRHLDRHFRMITNQTETWLQYDGRSLLNLGSNNYLNLASHQYVKEAIARTALTYGGSTGSSRLIEGNTPLHQELEERLAKFKHTESALLFNSGFAENTGVIPALVRQGDLIWGDELNHASLIDGSRHSGAVYQTYPHADSSILEKMLATAVKSGHRGRRLVVTDTVFSMDGDLAPLKEIVLLCEQYEAMLVADEAHATGCVGPEGRGLVAAVGTTYEGVISTSTLSKALGSFGGFLTSHAIVTEFLVNVSRPLIFTTSLPPTVIAASLASLDLLEQDPQMVDRLQQNAAFFREGLQRLGLNTLNSVTQIVPVVVKDSSKALEMAEALRQEGVFAGAIRYPTVPLGAARVRASVMANHTQDDLGFALNAFEIVSKRLNLI